jgi:hypothetical protein
MVSKFTELVVDARDPRSLAAFWCEVLGYRVVDEAEVAGGVAVEIADWDLEASRARSGPVPPTLVFVPVPEDKTVKNRLHIDVNAVDRDQAEEVERLLGLGATRADVGQREQSWVVLADPEGNEFCVLRSRRP